jgi:hypothetical protein
MAKGKKKMSLNHKKIRNTERPNGKAWKKSKKGKSKTTMRTWSDAVNSTYGYLYHQYGF